MGESSQQSNYGYSLVTVNGNTITAVYYIYDQTTNTWSPFDTYVYTMTSRKFGANNANQTIEPTTLNDYYQGIRIIKIGSGMLTLNPGVSTYTDGFTVSGGTLNVRGDYSLAPVTVQSGGGATLGGAGKVAGVTVDAGGAFSGTGTVYGVLANAGNVNPGNSPGIMNVVGSYSQSASGNLSVEIASLTNYDKLNVTGAPGTASLNGTLTPILLGVYRPLVNQVFPGVVTTTGGWGAPSATCPSPSPSTGSRSIAPTASTCYSSRTTPTRPWA